MATLDVVVMSAALPYGRASKTLAMKPNAPKILIISSDTGGGHRSAAAAIVAGIESFVKGESYAVRVVRAVEESHHLAAKLVAIYNWLLRYQPLVSAHCRQRPSIDPAYFRPRIERTGLGRSGPVGYRRH